MAARRCESRGSFRWQMDNQLDDEAEWDLALLLENACRRNQRKKKERHHGRLLAPSECSSSVPAQSMRHIIKVSTWECERALEPAGNAPPKVGFGGRSGIRPVQVITALGGRE
uniref:Uncharacterized protein n=1 Tax=Eutreptiella gymnastica TaxID=73025 RepID=A0A7S4G956_9EUGL